MVKKTGILRPKPYARLITMLSEQLIKNHVVALTELVKNSYDADATWVQIRVGNMSNFGIKDLSSEDEQPYVEIEDNGDGMTFEIIKNAWMNPATPEKYRKRIKFETKTRLGRTIQGEKGIGRFAVHQIGKKVEIFTRARNGSLQPEIHLTTDLSKYSDELIGLQGELFPEEPLYLEEIESTYSINDNAQRVFEHEMYINDRKVQRPAHGTVIRITNLNYIWLQNQLKQIERKIAMLGSPFHKMDFETSFVFEGQEMSTADEFQLETVLEEALVEIKASVDETGIASYILNDGKKSQSGRLDLVGQLRANDTKEVKEHFFLNGERTHNPECGPFEIRLYAFDLQQISDRRLKEYIRTRRIYIYRDGMRVYPYGDTDNDWIKIDVYRGTQKAGYYLSNDQVMGYIDISAEGNPNLRDKTNREGLLENTSAYEDLRVIVISALSFLKAEFEKRKIDRELGIHTREKKGKLHLQSEKVNNRLELLEKHLQDINDSDGNNLLSKLRNDYYKERSIVEHQIDIVEDLAGIGIAVDATSHDLLIVLDRAFETTQASLKALNSKPPNIEKAQDKLQHLLDQMMLVRNIMEGIQPLFRSARRRRQSMVVVDIISKVKRYFTKPLDKNRIEVREEVLGTPLVVQSSEGILLQLFINLFDNAIYWLKNSEISDRKIDILLDGEHGRVVFADNGPGVDQSDVDYIFEPFYSKKGLEGRGLGLYIARQLAERYDYELTYIMDKSEQISSGANFRVIFGDGGE